MVPINKSQSFGVVGSKHPKGVEVDAYGLTIVELNNIGYKDDQWVLASQVAQVLYVADPAKKTKHVVVPRK